MKKRYLPSIFINIINTRVIDREPYCQVLYLEKKNIQSISKPSHVITFVVPDVPFNFTLRELNTKKITQQICHAIYACAHE